MLDQQTAIFLTLSFCMVRGIMSVSMTMQWILSLHSSLLSLTALPVISACLW
jgi:hypothetical protein